MRKPRLLIAALAALLHPFGFAQTANAPAKTRENFMVVVRESIGANRSEDVLEPFGQQTVTLDNGQTMKFDLAWWHFIGDTQIRFVFDGEQTMTDASARDLQRLGIKSVEEALALAIANIERVYGKPTATPWRPGTMSVEGQSPDLNSSYFLDRAYWQSVLKAHPQGIVVCVAKRGGLAYTPLSNTQGVEDLKRNVAYLYQSSGRLRVSSALYLFKDGKWSVFQAPIKPAAPAQ